LSGRQQSGRENAPRAGYHPLPLWLIRMLDRARVPRIFAVLSVIISLSRAHYAHCGALSLFERRRVTPKRTRARNEARYPSLLPVLRSESITDVPLSLSLSRSAPDQLLATRCIVTVNKSRAGDEIAPDLSARIVKPRESARSRERASAPGRKRRKIMTAHAFVLAADTSARGERERDGEMAHPQ